MIILVINLASAVPSVEINVSPSFSEGDIIKFSYTILSSQDEHIQYLERVNCTDSPEALLNLKELNLTRNELFSGEYVYGAVDENIKSGNCSASIFILEPYNLEFKKTFRVNNLLELSITPLICKDASCAEKAKIFLRGEKIYINYISSVENSAVKGVLTLPDMSTQQLVLPTSIAADKIGTYTLEITATKEGYKNVSVTEQFAVIDQNANVKDAILPKNNISIQSRSNLIFWIIGGIALLIIILGTALYLWQKNKKALT